MASVRELHAASLGRRQARLWRSPPAVGAGGVRVIDRMTAMIALVSALTGSMSALAGPVSALDALVSPRTAPVRARIAPVSLRTTLVHARIVPGSPRIALACVVVVPVRAIFFADWTGVAGETFAATTTSSIVVQRFMDLARIWLASLPGGPCDVPQPSESRPGRWREVVKAADIPTTTNRRASSRPKSETLRR